VVTMHQAAIARSDWHPQTLTNTSWTTDRWRVVGCPAHLTGGNFFGSLPVYTCPRV